MTPVRITIGGDICPINRNLPSFKRGDAGGCFSDLLDQFKAANLSLANLECPLIERETPIRKSGPVLGAESACINGFLASKIQVLGLANNHILDHGAAGIENTLRVCKNAGIQTFGAGGNLAQAREILVVRAGSVRIGLLGLAEQEWSIASENSAGANPIDLIDCVRNINEHRDSFDYLIVLLHGGVEDYPFPSPRLMERCRFLIEQGARLVACQHSHCAGCYESYRGGHIIYGQGNLIFDAPGRPPEWQEGFLISLLISDSDFSSTWKPIPYIQSDALSGARRMRPEREEPFLRSLRERSTAIQDKQFVHRSWEAFCQTQQHSFMSATFGYGRLLTRLNRNGGVVRHLHGDQTLRVMKNCVSCEAHREVLLTVLNQYLNEHTTG